MKKISLSLNVIFIVFFLWYFFIHIGVSSYYYKYISPRDAFLDNAYYKEKVITYEELNKRLNHNIKYDVFIGDSLIEQFPVNEIFPKRNILNRGIRSDSTVGLLKRLDQNVNNIKEISRIFLLVGNNDLPYRSSEKICQNILLIFSRIGARKKYFISILPCDSPESDAQIKVINGKVKSLSEKKELEYIDAYYIFVGGDGKLNGQYFYDGVHLNILGYLKLKEVLKQYMN